MKKILLCCACLIVFVAYDNPRNSQSTYNKVDNATGIHSQNSQLQDNFKSLESRFSDPLPIIASIALKIDTIPNINKVLESKEIQDTSQDTSITSKYRESYAEYHTMLDSVKNDDWNAIVRTDTINAISAYLINLNMRILQQDSLCQSFDEHYRDSKNLEALRILDNSILDEANAKKSLSQREANITLIANNKELGILMVYLAKSFNELVLEKYQKQCKG